MYMAETLIYYWGIFTTHIAELGVQYSVDPWIFAFFYFGLAPVVWISAAIAIKNLRNDKPAALMLTLFGVTFFSPYIYVLYAGKNLPVWVYAVIIGLICLGVINLYRKISTDKPDIDESLSEADLF